MASAPIGPANPEAGVIATSPATAPVAIPRTLGLSYLSHSTVIQLHFHDLRLEFAYTLLESEADLHDVRDFLGHANITTTKPVSGEFAKALRAALARLEERALGAGALLEGHPDEQVALSFLGHRDADADRRLQREPHELRLTRNGTSRLLKNTRIGLFSWPSCVSRPPRQRCARGHAVPTRGPATPAAGDQGHLASRFRNRTKL